ncbi:hypothetical protein ATCC90586_002024 [Pythium insidiosum]|nr:hypothetical protein ATCC90586_002024 [Pythium insidiosum]
MPSRTIPHCAHYVADVSYFVDSYCVGDASLLQDLSVVDSAKLAYLRECRRGLDSRIEANVTAEMPTLLQHRGALSFGDLSTCANGCSGVGECLAAGCKCNAGVTGFACDLKI